MHNKTFLKKIILLFFFGMFSTYSLEPYKVYPLIICFSAAIFFVLETTKLWHTFLFGFSFSFGWFLNRTNHKLLNLSSQSMSSLEYGIIGFSFTTFLGLGLSYFFLIDLKDSLNSLSFWI